MKTFVTRRSASPLVRLLFAFVLALGIASTSQAASSFFVSVNFAPPPIPVYAQPICPGPGYVWVPGYWAYGPEGYYWVPGYWVLPPFVGALWTPGYWGWSDGSYLWHAGYWGNHVGYYGGINYGFGYFGVGYSGGYWRGGSFYYNTAVNNVNVTTVNRHVYNQRVTEATTSRVSFNGGPGGISRQPTAQERFVSREAHRAATPIQVQHQNLAQGNRSQWASVNRGSPSVTATPRAAAFGERGQRGAPPGAIGAPQRESRAEFGRPETRTNMAPRPETRAQAAPRQEFHAQAAPRQEFRSQAPRPETQPVPRQEFRAQPAPRQEFHAQAAPRQEMRPQAAPRQDFRAQPAPRAEMHAQAPAPQRGEARGGRPGEERHENRG